MRRKNRNARKPTILSGKVIVIAIASCFTGFLYANPIAPTVISGNASFQTLGKTLNVTNTPGAIIQWNGFSIASNEITRFIQQSASSSVLNRVMGTDASNLLGQLLSTGKVFLINPNGVFVGGGAIIDTAGFVASSLRLSDSDFLSGKFKFEEHIGAAKIVNHGSISANGGPVYLVAPNVENHGVITSPTGEIILAAGKSVELVQAASPNLRVELTAGEFEALNVGKLIASSGRVGIFGTTVRNSGTVSASGASIDAASGKIFLRAKKDVTLDGTSVLTANGGKGGEITIQAGEKSAGGTLLADGLIEAKGSVEKGGMVQMLGDRVGLIGNARVDASGDAGGGTVLVGGDFQGKNAEIQNAERTYVGANASIVADAGTSGDGGKVIVWADEVTRFFGSVSAIGGSHSGNGGFSEISGKGSLIFNAKRVDLGALNGKGGTLLLDPDNIEISNNADANTTGFTAGTDNTEAFADDTGTNSVFDVAATTGSFAGVGNDATIELHATNDINVIANFNIATSTGNSNVNLVLRAGNNINVGTTANATITASGTGTLTLSADDNTANGSGNINIGSGTFTGGLVTAGQTITLKAVDLVIDPANGTVNAGAGTVNIFTSQPATATIGVGTVAGTLTVANNELSRITAGTLVFGDSTAQVGNITFKGATPTTGQNVTAAQLAGGAGSIVLDDTTNSAVALNTGAGNITLTAGTGGVAVTNTTNATAELSTSGTVSVTSDGAIGSGTNRLQLSSGVGVVTITTSNDNVFLNGLGSLTLGAIGTTGGNLDVTVGAASSLTVNGNISSSGGTISLDANTGTLTQNATRTISAGSGAITFTADSIDLGGGNNTIIGSSTITLAPSSANRLVVVGAAGGAGDFALNTTEVTALTDGFSAITIGHASGTGGITVSAITFTDPVTLRSPSGGAISVNGTITGTGDSSVTLDGPSATTTLNAGITTADQNITIRDNVVIGEGLSITLDTGAGGCGPHRGDGDNERDHGWCGGEPDGGCGHGQCDLHGQRGQQRERDGAGGAHDHQWGDEPV